MIAPTEIYIYAQPAYSRWEIAGWWVAYVWQYAGPAWMLTYGRYQWKWSGSR